MEGLVKLSTLIIDKKFIGIVEIWGSAHAGLVTQVITQKPLLRKALWEGIQILQSSRG
jgi:hypothetical protein